MHRKTCSLFRLISLEKRVIDMRDFQVLLFLSIHTDCALCRAFACQDSTGRLAQLASSRIPPLHLHVLHCE